LLVMVDAYKIHLRTSLKDLVSTCNLS